VLFVLELCVCRSQSYVIPDVPVENSYAKQGASIHYDKFDKVFSKKRDQLDATYFIITLFSAQHVSYVNTSILRSLRLIR